MGDGGGDSIDVEAADDIPSDEELAMREIYTWHLAFLSDGDHSLAPELKAAVSDQTPSDELAAIVDDIGEAMGEISHEYDAKMDVMYAAMYVAMELEADVQLGNIPER